MIRRFFILKMKKKFPEKNRITNLPKEHFYKPNPKMPPKAAAKVAAEPVKAKPAAEPVQKAPPKEKTEKVEKPEVDISKLKKDTRLIPIAEWDWDRIVYSEPQKGETPDGSGTFRRVKIQYRYDDQTIGPAIVELQKHYCFGVQPDNLDKDGKVVVDKETGQNKKLGGYKIPIVMSNQTKTNPEVTDEEQVEIDFFDQWSEELKRYAVENKAKIGKAGKTDQQIEALIRDSLLYRKSDDQGVIDQTVAPKLYANLIYYKNNKEIGTPFYGPGDKELNPLKLTGHFYVYATMRFDNLFFGGKNISVQYRVYDATVEPITRTPRVRLARANQLTDGDEADFGKIADKPKKGQMESDDEDIAGDD
jgi:hypothetical protein